MEWMVIGDHPKEHASGTPACLSLGPLLQPITVNEPSLPEITIAGETSGRNTRSLMGMSSTWVSAYPDCRQHD
jgi:hypothetical protein